MTTPRKQSRRKTSLRWMQARLRRLACIPRMERTQRQADRVLQLRGAITKLHNPGAVGKSLHSETGPELPVVVLGSVGADILGRAYP